MTLCCLGPEGTFSHEMARLLSDDHDDLLLFPTVTDVFLAVTERKCDGIVPVENSDAGAVGPVMDGLSRTPPVVITGEAYLVVAHHFAAAVPAGEITVLYAHPQAHDQCLNFIEMLGVPVIHTESNSASAAQAATHPAPVRSPPRLLPVWPGCPPCSSAVCRTQRTIPRGFCAYRQTVPRPGPRPASVL